MRSKRVAKATLACILSALLISSAGLPVLADTGSSGSTSSSGYYPSATNHNTNWGCGTLRIQLSYLADNSGVADMATVNKRYANLDKYPLFMMSGLSKGDSSVSHSTDYSESYSLEDIKKKINAEISKWAGTTTALPKGGYYGADSLKENRDDAQWYINGATSYYHFASSTGGSIFLEDVLGAVYNSTSADDIKDFWFFYTTMAKAVNADVDFMFSGDSVTSTLGTTLNEIMQDLYKNDVKFKKFKRGYAVAMKHIYGNSSTAIHNIYGDSSVSFSSLSKESKSNFSSAYNSFMFERLQTFHSSELQADKHRKSTGEYDNNFSMSVSSFLAFCANKNGNTSTALDNHFLYELSYDVTNNWQSGLFNYWNYGVTSRMASCLYPTRKYAGVGYQSFDKSGNYCTADKRCFGGWAYFAFSQPTTNYKDLLLQNPDVAQVATEITYNAYLKGEGDTDYKSESNKFGDNGHVMTDTIYLSKIDDKVFSVGKPLVNTVNTSITLSTPIKDYLYNLTSLKYRITDASGSTIILDDSDGLKGSLNTSNGKVITAIEDLDRAKTIAEDSNSGDKYTSLLYRDKKDMTGSDINDISNNVKLYVYSGGTYIETGITTSSGDTAIRGIIKKYTISGYNPDDVDENSTEYLYIYNSTNKAYSPIVYESGTWYYCPIVKYTNLLVQIQADYVATYKKDDDIFNSVDMDEYLLAKNNNTSEFLSSGTKFYSMLDNLVTDVWGSLTSKSFTYKDINGVSLAYDRYVPGYSETVENGKVAKRWYKFGNYNSNFALTGRTAFWSTTSGEGYFDTNNTVLASDYDIIKYNSGDTFTYAKNAYVKQLVKTSPVLTSSTTNGTRVCSKLSTDIFKIDTSGNSTSQEKQANGLFVGYTAAKDAENLDGSTVITKLADDRFYPAEATVTRGVTNRLTGVNIANTQIGGIYGYKESTFTKLLTTYSAMTYTKRSDASSSSAVPKAVNWNIGVQTDTNGTNATALGLDASSSATLLKAVLGDYTGFIRFGKTDYSNGELFNRQNNGGANASLTRILFDPSMLLTTDEHNLSNSKTATLFAPFSQNSIDVPLTYNFNVYTPKILTPPSVTSSTPISTGSTVTQSTSTSSVLKVYPEVTMWGEDKQTSSTATKSYTPVITVGQRQREIPIVAYNKLSLLDNDVVPTISSTAIALDTRAKALSTRLTGYDNVPVVYSGSQINLSYESTGVGTVKTYMLDIVDSTLKSTWGNTPIAPKSVMMTYLSKFKSTVEPIVSIRNTDTSTDKEISFGEVTGDINLSGDPKETGSWLLTVKGGVVKSVSYNGKTYTVSNASSTSSLKVTNSSGSVDSTCKLIREVLLGTKVCGDNNVLAKCFETNGGKSVDASLSTWLTGNADALDDRSATGGWYYEDTSVLCIKEYTGNFNLPATIANEQIPINLGPVTPANKNNYFSNGYPATVHVNYKLGVTNGSTFTGITGEMHSNKADFIISDVTINDATTY